MYRQFVKYLLRNRKPLYAQCFEIDVAVENALTEVIPPSPLDDVHNERGDADGNEEDGEDDDKKDPQTWELATGVYNGLVSWIPGKGLSGGAHQY